MHHADYIAERVEPEPMSGCWLWTLGLDAQGYGTCRFNGRTWRAHRLAFILAGGSLKTDRNQLDHVCRVRSCVNPQHLRPVTCRENLMEPRTSTQARINFQKTSCKHGHALTKENVRIVPRGRDCKECHRLHRLGEMYLYALGLPGGHR